MVAISKISAPLARSSYSCEWLINSLRKEDESFRNRFRDSSIKTVTYHEVGEGTGFMSKVYRVEIHFTDNNKPYTVIFKVPQAAAVESFVGELIGPNGQRKMSNIAMAAIQMHQREVEFYETFCKADGILLPKVFAAETYVENKRDGTILMENLCESGILMQFPKTINIAKLLNLIKVVANFNAETLSRLRPAQIANYSVNVSELQARKEVAKVAFSEAINKFPEVFEGPLTKLSNIVEKTDYFDYIASSGINRDLNIPAVLTHGDLHPNNIFWKKNADGTCSDEIHAIIDWQTVFAGTVGHDISFLMLLNCDGIMRRHCEEWIFQYYHAVLKTALYSKGMEMPFTLEQIQQSYRRIFMYNTCFLLYAVPVFAKSVFEKEQLNCLQRVRYALDDALAIMQEDLPQFL